MLIYAIISDYIYDSCDAEVKIEMLTDSKKKAIKRYAELVENAKKDWPKKNFIHEEHECSFWAFDDGRISESHYNIRLETKELE